MPAYIDLDIPRLVEEYIVNKSSMGDIAKALGVGKNTVRKRLILAGVQFERGDRISRKMLGRRSPRKGVTLSPETRLKISLAKMGNNNCIGRIVSQETRERIRAAQKGRPRYAPGAAAIIEHQRQKFKHVLKSLLRAAKKKKQARTADALGYSRAELVEHISAQFLPGMSWGDRSSFSIDHRVPIVIFVRHGITDPKIVSSLANLRPMDPKANRQKSARYSGDFDADMAAIIAFNAGRHSLETV